MCLPVKMLSMVEKQLVILALHLPCVVERGSGGGYMKSVAGGGGDGLY